jgi:hypothetical protein
VKELCARFVAEHARVKKKPCSIAGKLESVGFQFLSLRRLIRKVAFTLSAGNSISLGPFEICHHGLLVIT